MVFGHNGLRNGEPHAKTAGERPGFIRAVKPVEQLIQLEGVYICISIFNNEHRMVLPVKPQPDAPARIAVFYGIIQQNGSQPPEQRLVAVV